MKTGAGPLLAALLYVGEKAYCYAALAKQKGKERTSEHRDFHYFSLRVYRLLRLICQRHIKINLKAPAEKKLTE